MGNIKYFTKQGSCGKVDTLLNNKLNNVEWGEFRLDELFGEASRGKRLKSSDRIYGDLPFVTAGETNEGISAYIGNDITIFSANTITIDMFGSARYRNYIYGADDHVSIVHTEDISKLATIFITSAINKAASTGKFDYANNFYPKDADELIIQLPIKNNEIDYEFMESFVKDLENDYVSNLEISKHQKTDDYLSVSDLLNYNLTSQEQNILDDFLNDSIEWGVFRLNELFEKIKVKSLKYKTSELPNKPTGKFILPALTAGVKNQGLNNFVPVVDATILNNVISISANGANTGVTFYQSKNFTVLQDAYALKWKYSNDLLSDNQYLYLTSLISKTIFKQYEWTNKAGWEKIKLSTILLPIKNNEIDYGFMQNFTKIIQKLIIKDFNTLKEKKIKTAKEFIKKDTVI